MSSFRAAWAGPALVLWLGAARAAAATGMDFMEEMPVPVVGEESGPPADRVQLTLPGRGPVELVLVKPAVNLTGLLNRQWRTDVTRTLGTEKVHLSGTADREKKWYLTLFVEGWKEPQFFRVDEISRSACGPGSARRVRAKVGNAAYCLAMHKNIFSLGRNRFIFQNEMNPGDHPQAPLRELVDGLVAIGQPLVLEGDTYRIFYYDVPRPFPDGARLDPDAKSLAFVFQVTGLPKAYTLAAEDVPSDRVRVFNLPGLRRGPQDRAASQAPKDSGESRVDGPDSVQQREGRLVGLRKAGDLLWIYQRAPSSGSAAGSLVH